LIYGGKILLSPSLSDWINLIIAEKNRNNNWLIADVSSIFVILTVYVILIDIFGINLANIIMLPLYILFLLVCLSSIKSINNILTIKWLINDIFNGKIKSIKEIEKRWFKRDENMYKKIKNYLEENESKSYKAIGTFETIIGIICFGIAIHFAFNNNLFGMSIFLTFSIGIISIGIALYSLGLSKDSDEKMKSIATGDFYDLANRFWDRAPVLYKEISKGARDTQSWQLGNLFRHAEKLKKWAEPVVQERLIREFKTFLERLRTVPIQKYWVEIKNYRSTCRIAIDFNTKDDNMKNDLIKELGNWLGKKKEDESNLEFLDRKSKEFSNKKDDDVFNINENEEEKKKK